MYFNKDGDNDQCGYDDKGYGDMIKNSMKSSLQSILETLQDPLESHIAKQNRILQLQHILKMDNDSFEKALLKENKNTN